MKIGYQKGEGTLVSRCEVDYPAITYNDEDWIQKMRGDISIKVRSRLSNDYVQMKIGGDIIIKV